MHIVLGPPGTGKTYRLLNHYMQKEIKENKTDAQKIIYITFSKAAAKEARDRIEELFPGVELKYISKICLDFCVGKNSLIYEI